MHLCPVGAILVKGTSMARPFGHRKYDEAHATEFVPLEKPKVQSNGNGKKIVAQNNLNLDAVHGMGEKLLDEMLLEIIQEMKYKLDQAREDAYK